MPSLPPPDASNQWHAEHVSLLIRSLRRITGVELVPPGVSDAEVAKWLYEAPFAIVSHGIEADPIFNYANLTALTLFEMTWEEFTSIPSRLSAEPVHRDERARLMASVQEKGYIDNYGGIRISKHGKRFRIENAIVWNLVDSADAPAGQAAMFETWTYV
jgi:MEKHLA domain